MADGNSALVARFVADALVVLHLGFILFVVLGGLLVLPWQRIAWVHLPCAVWGVLIELGGWVCPLTVFENQLRHAGGSAGYAGGFVDHYLVPVVYPAALTRGLQVSLGAVAIAVNVVIYGGLLVARKQSMSAHPSRARFQAAYEGKPPWDLGRPQQPFVEVADQMNRTQTRPSAISAPRDQERGSPSFDVKVTCNRPFERSAKDDSTIDITIPWSSPTKQVLTAMKDFLIQLTHRPGEMADVTNALSLQGVNIKSLAAMALGNQALLRFIPDDAETARNALRAQSIRFEEQEVITVLLENRAGELTEVAAKLADAGLNLQAVYVVGLAGDLIELAIAVDDVKKAKKVLE
ncbi:MAG: hypothetical protein A2W31_15185 [Planctomycetes bacterium RBG_16_64_10]|nr:MAG: hypothetical protein A2W31_15185 [Planctomycetes bacterium RBG_16_64_10]